MASLFPLKIITPYGMFFEEEVSIVTTKTPKGYLGILKDHIPLIANIEISMLSLTDAKNNKFKYAIGGGLLFVESTGTTIITDSIIDVQNINLEKEERERKETEILIQTTKDEYDLQKIKASLQRTLNNISSAKGK